MNTADHDSSRKFFAELGRQTEGISSIIEFGTTRAAGLSDIDIMAVVKSEDSINAASGWGDMTSYPDDVRSAQDGGVVKIVTGEQFAQLPLLGAMNVKLIYGPPVGQMAIDEDTRHLILVADVMDWLAERIVTLNAHIQTKGAHATRAINCAYSISHTYQRAAAASAINIRISDSYRQEVDAFRSYWQDSPDLAARKLVSWLTQRLEDALFLAVRFGEYVEANGYYLRPVGADESRFRFNNGALFFDACKTSNLNEGPTVPGVWLAHLVSQSQLAGLIPAEIRKRIEGPTPPGDVQVATELRKLLTTRMALCNSIAGMLLPMGMRDNIYRFGHLLSSPQVPVEGHRD